MQNADYSSSSNWPYPARVTAQRDAGPMPPAPPAAALTANVDDRNHQHGPVSVASSMAGSAGYGNSNSQLAGWSGYDSKVMHSQSAVLNLAPSEYQNARSNDEQWQQQQQQQQQPFSEMSAYAGGPHLAYQPYFYKAVEEGMLDSHWPAHSQQSSFTSHPPEAASAIEGSDVSGFAPHRPPVPASKDVASGLVQQHSGQGGIEPYAVFKMEVSRLLRAQESTFDNDDPKIQLKSQNLNLLEKLATQLIQTMAKASFQQIQEFMQNADSEEAHAYATLKHLFDQTRQVYSRGSPFIDAIAIQMFQPSQQEVIRKANIATFLTSVLGAHDVSFFQLNEFFMETFVPLGHRLLKWQGAIFLELKTQAYISALINSSNGSQQAMLDELFPSDLDAQILTRHPDAPSLSPSEQDFIDRSRARRSYLLAENSPSARQELPRKYQWQDFSREFASCINKNIDGLLNLPPRSSQSGAAGAAAASSARDAAGTISAAVSTQDSLRSNSIVNSSALPGGQIAAGSTAAKDRTDAPRNASTASIVVRQPWTKPEEDALLDGLNRVSGPHWSQILALYGRGGSISEVLKDRNQVQLKDKARNLKLWHLKMGKDVPEALKGVTGELRKRGGARARAALNAQEEAAAEESAAREENADMELDGGESGRRESDYALDRSASGAQRKGKRKGP